MRLILLSGGVGQPGGPVNIGDLAQLEGVLNRLLRRAANLELVLVPNAGSEALPPHLGGRIRLQPAIRQALVPTRRQGIVRCAIASTLGPRRRPRWLRNVADELVGAGAVIAAGAGLFADPYATGVGALWGTLFHLARHLDVPVFLTGQQIGPLSRPAARWISRWALRAADTVGVRDPLSLALARDLLGRQPPVVFTGDDAWDLEPDTDTGDRLLAALGVSAPYIVCQVRFGSQAGIDSRHEVLYARTVEVVSSALGVDIIFVPFFLGAPNDDVAAAQRVGSLIRRRWHLLPGIRRPAVVKGVMSRALLGIGTANHFAVFAASQGIPVLALFDSDYMKHKFRGLSEVAANLVVPKQLPATVEDLAAAAREACASRGQAVRLPRTDVLADFLARLASRP